MFTGFQRTGADEKKSGFRLVWLQATMQLWFLWHFYPKHFASIAGRQVQDSFGQGHKSQVPRKQFASVFDGHIYLWQNCDGSQPLLHSVGICSGKGTGGTRGTCQTACVTDALRKHLALCALFSAFLPGISKRCQTHSDLKCSRFPQNRFFFQDKRDLFNFPRIVLAKRERERNKK